MSIICYIKIPKYASLQQPARVLVPAHLNEHWLGKIDYVKLLSPSKMLFDHYDQVFGNASGSVSVQLSAD